MLPTDIKLHQKSGILELQYQDDSYELSAEFLRVHSPSAEVRGHGPGQEILQHGKKEVRLLRLETVGNYALRLYFDDDHNTGLYSWDYLRELCIGKQKLWQNYLLRLKAAGQRREKLPTDTRAVKIFPMKEDKNHED